MDCQQYKSQFNLSRIEDLIADLIPAENAHLESQTNVLEAKYRKGVLTALYVNGKYCLDKVSRAEETLTILLNETRRFLRKNYTGSLRIEQCIIKGKTKTIQFGLSNYIYKS